MNPRVSRSSAFGSKATGFPIAKVAARLAVGYTFDELENDITKGETPASFEPLHRLYRHQNSALCLRSSPAATDALTTAMKSVGEVMAIGRDVRRKACKRPCVRMETGLTGPRRLWGWKVSAMATTRTSSEQALGTPSPDRILKVAQALRLGVDGESTIYSSCKRSIPGSSQRLAEHRGWWRQKSAPMACQKAERAFRDLKAMGFSDARLATLSGLTESRSDSQAG